MKLTESFIITTPVFDSKVNMFGKNTPPLNKPFLEIKKNTFKDEVSQMYFFVLLLGKEREDKLKHPQVS